MTPRTIGTVYGVSQDMVEMLVCLSAINNLQVPTGFQLQQLSNQVDIPMANTQSEGGDGINQIVSYTPATTYLSMHCTYLSL